MTKGLFIGQGRPRPRLFLAFLLLFLVLGTVLASAVTGADYVRGNGGAAVPDDRPGPAAAFSAQDDRCVLVAVAVDGAPQAFLLWRLRPAAGAMTVTAYAADKRLQDSDRPLDALFGDGGRAGCERVCDAFARARIGAPSHYIVIGRSALRALMERLGDTLTIALPARAEDPEPSAGGRQAVTAERLLSLLSAPPSGDPGDRAALARFCGDVWAALCERFFTAARADELPGDFAALVNHAQTDLGISHFVAYRDALTALTAQNAE